MSFETQILADVARRERARALSPARLERWRVARLAEAIARCCRPTAVARLRTLLHELRLRRPFASGSRR